MIVLMAMMVNFLAEVSEACICKTQRNIECTSTDCTVVYIRNNCIYVLLLLPLHQAKLF